MTIFFQCLLLCTITNSYVIENKKNKMCVYVKCNEMLNEIICGMRIEKESYHLRIFNNECDLIKYGCNVSKENAYGLTDIENCKKAFPDYFNKIKSNAKVPKISCIKHQCIKTTDSKNVCGIRKDANGYRMRIFKNECHLNTFNCENNLQFKITDLYICKEANVTLEAINKSNEKQYLDRDVDKNENFGDSQNKLKKNNDSRKANLIIVDASKWNINRDNINNSINDFFAATHLFDLPMRDLHEGLDQNSRRMLLKYDGPIKVFKPWIVIPKNVSEDNDHIPTLSSCYHKCPKKCPDTYAPVCGVPGMMAQEPSLMFQNHCYMDVAQCKMYRENKSPTAQSSSYIESTFLFCLGDELNGLYRFLPLVRTLQHMGRLKNKGHYRHRIRNMRFFNDLLMKEPNIQG